MSTITRTRAKTFKEFLHTHLKEELEDIAQGGADAGWAYLTYTSDCVALFEKYQDEIWELAVGEAEVMGCKNVCEMIAGFNRADMMTTIDSFKNLMVWFAAETYARELTNH